MTHDKVRYSWATIRLGIRDKSQSTVVLTYNLTYLGGTDANSFSCYKSVFPAAYMEYRFSLDVR